MTARNIEMLPVSSLRPWAKNARIHSRKQIRQIADSIKRFGFTNPVLIDGDNTILAGHGRVAAAETLGMSEVPCLRIETMSPAERRAYVLADNKLALNAGWDEEILAEELKGLLDLDLELRHRRHGLFHPRDRRSDRRAHNGGAGRSRRRLFASRRRPGPVPSG
jgi:ParB-like chromosome segregation protein Spo0J